MKLTWTDAVFSRTAMMLFYVLKRKVLETYWKSMGALFGINKNFWAKEIHQGPRACPRDRGAPPPPHRACPLSRGPPGPPPTSTPTPYILFRGEKNQREGSIVFYNTELLPSVVLPREGRSGVCLGIQRGESIAIVIINHPPSPISWCSPPCVSNSIVGLLDGDGLDEIYHVIELVLLGFDP